MDPHEKFELLCANVSQDYEICSDCPHCKKRGLLICGRCHLVKYCGTICQKRHYQVHKADCRKAALHYEKLYADYVLLEPPPENLDLYFPGKATWIPDKTMVNLARYYDELFNVPWATKPPRDILNLAKNEGLDYQKDLCLSFTGAKDLGNVMTTINTLPASYDSQCTVSINEFDPVSFLRNILILGLAMVEGAATGATVETITHLWYSASFTEEMYDQFTEVCRDILKACGDPDAIADDDFITVAFGVPRAKSKLYMTLKKQHILIFQMWFGPFQTLPTDYFEETRKSVMGEDHDPLLNHFKDMWLAQIPPAYRVLDEQYRKTGVLLPYGTNTAKFCKPNVTFGTNNKLNVGHLARPTDSADLPMLVEFAKKHKLPPNDVNGALYHSRMAMVSAFCKKMATHKVEFHVSTFRTPELPTRLLGSPDKDWGFDRIDIGVKPSASLPSGQFLAEFIELLKSKNENRYAKMSLLVSTESDGALIGGEKSGRREAQDLLPWRRKYFDIWTGGSGSEVASSPSKWKTFARMRIKAVHEMMDEAKKNWNLKLRLYGWADKQGPLGRTLVITPLSDEEEWPYQLRYLDFMEEAYLLRMCGSAKGNERLIMWEHSA